MSALAEESCPPDPHRDQDANARIEHLQLLLDEANHRFKNNLQVLCSLVEVAHREASNLEARAILSDVSHRVAAMGAAQQVLYDAGHSSKFDARSLLNNIDRNASLGFAQHARIVTVCEMKSASLPSQTAMPLALILNELLMNAAKHATNQRGEVNIKVSFAERARSYELIVQDDGPGFDLKEAHGSKSSGLGLIAALARQLHGCFTVECNSGARCIVRWPASPARLGDDYE